MKSVIGIADAICVIFMFSVVNVNEEKRQLVVILIDGVRWDYVDLLDKDKLHGFSYFLKNGVRAQYVQTIFPSTSLPAWTTLCTGLYAENHDILGNDAFDPESNMFYSLNNISSTDSPILWSVEQLWTTATKAGLKVATIDWSRSDIPFNGVVPIIASAYRSTEKGFSEKMTEAYNYIKEGFDLVMVYTEIIDHLGHMYGSAVEKVIAGMQEIGEILETFIKSLISNHFSDQVDIIVVSDHGMHFTCNDDKLHVIYLMQYYNIRQVVGVTSLGTIIVESNSFEYILYQLNSLSNYTVYIKNDIPETFHYKHSKRAPDLIVVAKEKEDICEDSIGHHGYMSKYKDMRTIFLAYGKSFIGEGIIVKPFKLVDIYQIFCHVLSIQPNPHNGSWDRVKYIFSRTEHTKERERYFLERKRYSRLLEERLTRRSILKDWLYFSNDGC